MMMMISEFQAIAATEKYNIYMQYTYGSNSFSGVSHICKTHCDYVFL